jgi:hypothetical protein
MQEDTTKQQKIREMFGLSGDDLNPSSAGVGAVVYAVANPDWNPTTRIPLRLRAKLMRTLQSSSNVASETVRQFERQLETHFDLPRPECQEIVLVGRAKVLDEVGGILGGSVGTRVADALEEWDGFINVEPISSTEVGPILERLLLQEPSCRDEEGRPIFVIGKEEEKSTTPYDGDSWPRAAKRAKNE